MVAAITTGEDEDHEHDVRSRHLQRQKGRRGLVDHGAPLMTGSSGRTRTYNPSVNSRMLYR